MTRSDFHRSTILRGDLFSFQADTGEAWREESLFEQVDAPKSCEITTTYGVRAIVQCSCGWLYVTSEDENKYTDDMHRAAERAADTHLGR